MQVPTSTGFGGVFLILKMTYMFLRKKIIQILIVDAFVVNLNNLIVVKDGHLRRLNMWCGKEVYDVY